ncbi:MAG TPA: patatin-like phospholipase family protein [Trebonia sp.]|jgi:NTE family protein|nr:patatin-like phospholipase family protein [Trebonia sp.]
MTAEADTALVLGGGGVAGIAWITGLLAGLADAGQDVTGAGRVIGTSAGATVTAQLGSGLPLEDLVARQVDPARQSAEIFAEVNFEAWGQALAPYLDQAESPEGQLRQYGAFALAAGPVAPEADRLAVIASRLPSHDWPARDITLVAVDCASGALAAFTAASGVDLIPAVAASCAVPGIWPPVTIGGRRYMDGGVRSSDNADLAEGAAEVIVVSPLGSDSPLPSPLPLGEVVARLRAGGARVTVIEPDAASRAAIGANALDPATRVPATTAGRAQGRRGLPPAR